jgi:prevent-host-death family protein
VREVTLRELDQRASRVIASVRDGERMVVTKRGAPVAVILSLPDLLDLTGWPERATPVLTPLEATRLASEALKRVAGEAIERRVWRQALNRYIHGRWWQAADSRP